MRITVALPIWPILILCPETAPTIAEEYKRDKGEIDVQDQEYGKGKIDVQDQEHGKGKSDAL